MQFAVNLDPDSDNFDGPDNITVAPDGGLILCSDGEGRQHLSMVSPTGEPTIFARNAHDDGEFTGAVGTSSPWHSPRIPPSTAGSCSSRALPVPDSPSSATSSASHHASPPPADPAAGRSPPAVSPAGRPPARTVRSSPTPTQLLDLPEGFTYRIVSEAGQPLVGVDGIIPDRFDGTAFFDLDGRTFLVRNSEQEIDEDYPAVAGPEYTYDPVPHGRHHHRRARRRGERRGRVRQPRRHAQQLRRRRTPWGTWLSCEETEARAGDDGMTMDHGFVFEVDPPNPDNNTTPTPLTALGRFAHEAVMHRPRERCGVPHRGRQRAQRAALPRHADHPARGHGRSSPCTFDYGSAELIQLGYGPGGPSRAPLPEQVTAPRPRR